MAFTITAAISRIKSDVARILTPDSIRAACRRVGHSWRERVLDPATTVHLFLLQVLHGNTACSHVPHLGGVNCTGEAYNQARNRLPLEVLRDLLARLAGRLPTFRNGLWRGHRTLLIDGTGLSMPDTPALQQEFGQPGSQAKGCGYPVMHLLAVFDCATGFLVSVATAALRTHDLSRAAAVHQDLGEGDILVGDRAFCSYAHMALLAKHKAFGMFRVHQRQIVDFKPHRKRRPKCPGEAGLRGLPNSDWIKRLGRYDQLVRYHKPAAKPKWLDEASYAALPETLVVRELRYRIPTSGCRTKKVTLATTLLDPVKYPASALEELYRMRWQIETNFRHIKQTMRMDSLHCQTVEGVQKEVAMYMLVYNLIRLVMLEAAEKQTVAVDRISFVDAARWLAVATHQEHHLRLRTNPLRQGRVEPRCVKRRPKQYPRLQRPREELRKRLMSNMVAA